MNKKFSIVLLTPEIPGNTGSIGRTCLALGARLVLIKPYGFDLSEKAVRRAGLDYWKHVDLTEYEDWDEFISNEKPVDDQLLFFENATGKLVYDAPFKKNCYLVFGSETKGTPNNLVKKYKESFYELPMYSEHIRSLNLSNAVTAVAYECIRHLL